MNGTELKRYDNIAFWAWNERMEDEEIRLQIKRFSEQGFQGFFMHARAGLEIPYLGKEWFRAAETAVRTAAEHGMNAWIYDEDGWPSGFAGGRVNGLGEDYQIKYLKMTEGPGTGIDPAKVVARYAKDGDEYRLVDDEDTASADMTIYMIVDAYYVDLLNPDVTDAFIRSTHEEYKKHLGQYFGTVIKGVFTDEPQVHSAGFAWSHALPELFEELHGYNLKERLFELFTELDSGFKLDYIKTINTAFSRHFVKKLHRWCEDNGLALTGHFSAEDGLVHQSLVNGGVMAMYPDFHIPGIDYLGKRLTSPVLLKQVSSIKNQFGLPYVLSETFGCAGWDVSFAELAWIWAYQAARGVNLATLHGTMYSIKGIRKRDYPAFYSYHEPWSDHMKEIFTWMGNLNRIMSTGHVTNRIGIIHPIHSVNAEKFFSSEQCHISNQFRELVEAFEAVQADFDLIDETVLKTHGSVKNGTVALGRQNYDILIVPEMSTVESSTLGIIKDMLRSGGKVVCVNRYPSKVAGRPSDEPDDVFKTYKPPIIMNRQALWDKWLTQSGYDRTIVFRDSSGYRLADGLIVSVIHREEETICLVLNTSTVDTKNAWATYHESASVWATDPSTMEESPYEALVEHDRTMFEVTLKPMESVVFMFRSPDLYDGVPSGAKPDLSRSLKDVDVVLRDDNALTIDRLTYRIGEGDESELVPAIKAVDMLYEEANRIGRDLDLRLTYRFVADDIPGRLMMHAETERVNGIRVNGHDIGAPKGWHVDKAIRSYDIRQHVLKGENTITFDLVIPSDKTLLDVEEIYETERNRFYHPVDVESIYLTGDFDLVYDGDIKRRTNHYRLSGGTYRITKMSPKRFGHDLTSQHLWFYRGSVDHVMTVGHETGTKQVLELEELATPVTEIIINGLPVGTVWKPPYRIDLTNHLKTGDNSIVVRAFSSNRNLLGPHHHYRGEPLFVGVNTFKGTFGFEDFVNPDAPEVTWDDGDHLVGFHVGKIIVHTYRK